MIVIGVISLFLSNENFNHFVALNKIIFNFKIYLRDKEEYLCHNVIYRICSRNFRPRAFCAP
jgi:hypothetical protein